MVKRIFSLNLIVCFLLSIVVPLPKTFADTILDLPAPGTMVNLSPAYEPVIIKGLTVHKDNPFLFDFIVDTGQDKISGGPLKKEGEKLVKYFLASLAIPDKDVWVNLSPYEKNRMIPEVLGQTDMGRDLLEQDYILKQITASLIYPEKQLGKIFWDKVYTKAQQMYGTTQVPVNTFNKVWITADRAEVFEHNQTAFVVDSHLKVMLEEDYLALHKHSVETPFMASPNTDAMNRVPTKMDTHTVASQVVRQIILPQLEKEVNTGKNFANLRQIFNSIILASWYKRNLKQALLNQVYSDQSKVRGIDLSDLMVKQQIYEQYLKAYKKGVFNYIKEDINKVGSEPIPRKYFSGGIDKGMAANPVMVNNMLKFEDSLPHQDQRLVDLAMLAVTHVIDQLPPDGIMNAWAATNDLSRIDWEFHFVLKKQLFSWEKKKVFYDFMLGYLEHKEAFQLSDEERKVLDGIWLKLKYNLNDESFGHFYNMPDKIKEEGSGNYKHQDGRLLTPGALIRLANDAKFLWGMTDIHRRIYLKQNPSYQSGDNRTALELAQDMEKMALKLSELKFEKKPWAATNDQEDVERSWVDLLEHKKDFPVQLRKFFEDFLKGELSPVNAYLLFINPASNLFIGAWLKLQYDLDEDSFDAYLKNPSGITQEHEDKFKHFDGKKLEPKEIENMAEDAVLLWKRITILGLVYLKNINPVGYQDDPRTESELLEVVETMGTLKHNLGKLALMPKRIKTSVNSAETALEGDPAVISQKQTPGGIDLSTSGMQWKDSKDSHGVEMDVDPALIARVKREGIENLSPVFLGITPITSIWPLLGLQAPANVEHLAEM